MTQTLDVAGRLSQLDSAHAVEAPASTAQTRTRFGTFAITFGIASTLLYTVFERLNWPLFTYLPRVNRVEFWLYRAPPAESPPMYWYGWIVLSAIAAVVVGLIATMVPDRRLRQGTFFFCVLGVLWPTFLAVLRSFGPDWQALNIEFMNSAWAAAVPALVGTVAITYFVPAPFVQRVWTSLLLIVPIGGLIVLGYSLLQPWFLR
jgi:uncharacterized membrane protein YeaQ/YmgE (transglycosylase-associated protein family)